MARMRGVSKSRGSLGESRRPFLRAKAEAGRMGAALAKAAAPSRGRMSLPKRWTALPAQLPMPAARFLRARIPARQVPTRSAPARPPSPLTKSMPRAKRWKPRERRIPADEAPRQRCPQKRPFSKAVPRSGAERLWDAGADKKGAFPLRQKLQTHKKSLRGTKNAAHAPKQHKGGPFRQDKKPRAISCPDRTCPPRRAAPAKGSSRCAWPCAD